MRICEATLEAVSPYIGAKQGAAKQDKGNIFIRLSEFQGSSLLNCQSINS